MKVFLLSTPRGEGQLRENYQVLFDEIKKLGFEHVSDFIETSSEDFYDKMSEGRKAHVDFFNHMVDSIQAADICVFEASMPSLGVGFLIQRALDYSKPTIVLYYKDNTPYFLSGIEDDKLIVEGYTEVTLKKIIKKVLTVAREKRDKRFNFFLSPKLLTYLETASTGRGVTKSKLLRDMIVRHMRESASSSAISE